MTGVQRFYIFSLIVDVILNTSLPFFRKIPKLKIKFILTFDINKDKILNCKLKEMNQILSFNLKTISLEQQEHLFRVSYEIIVERETISKIYYEINY